MNLWQTPQTWFAQKLAMPPNKEIQPIKMWKLREVTSGDEIHRTNVIDLRWIWEEFEWGREGERAPPRVGEKEEGWGLNEWEGGHPAVPPAT